MDSTTVQFVVDTLAAHFTFNADEALHIIENAAAMTVPAYQKAVKLADATKAKLEELNAKVRDGKVRKGVDAPAKIAELEKKLEEQNTKIAELMTRGVKKGRAPKAAPEPAPEAAPESPPAKVVKPKKEKAPAAEKRMKRVSPAITKNLEGAFDTAKMEMKKDSPQEFAKYVNELTQDDFDARTLTDHMRDYVATISRQLAPAEAPTDGGIENISYNDLTRMRSVLVEAYGPGIYWNTVDKKFFTGPSADEDEDVTETTMNNEAFAVGDKTQRVYKEVDGEDTFVGFLGIGKFANMMVPK
jgi:hypothetical protein